VTGGVSRWRYGIALLADIILCAGRIITQQSTVRKRAINLLILSRFLRRYRAPLASPSIEDPYRVSRGILGGLDPSFPCCDHDSDDVSLGTFQSVFVGGRHSAVAFCSAVIMCPVPCEVAYHNFQTPCDTCFNQPQQQPPFLALSAQPQLGELESSQAYSVVVAPRLLPHQCRPLSASVYQHSPC